MVPRLHRYLGGASGNEVTESFMVAGGNGDTDVNRVKLAYSYDGINWIESIKVGSWYGLGEVNNVVTNGSMWLVSFFASDTIGYSLDGINWTTGETKWTDSSDGIWRGVNTVATNGSMWLCGGWDYHAEKQYGLIGYSSDGITWTASESARSVFGVGEEAECNTIVWNGSIWLASGHNDSGGVSAYSSDGITWTASTPLKLRYIAWNGLMWVGGSYGDSLVHSYDGINWNSSDLQKRCISLATNGSMWVAGTDTYGGNGSEIGHSLIYSYDGINWNGSANGNPIFTYCYSVAWNGTRWFACGSKIVGYNISAVIAYSTDGITWTRSTSADSLTGAVYWKALASRHVLPYTVPLCKRVNGTNSCVIEDTKYRILE